MLASEDEPATSSNCSTEHCIIDGAQQINSRTSHFDLPQRSKKSKEEEEKKQDQNITVVKGPNYCLPKAIVVGIAHMKLTLNRDEHRKEWRRIFRSDAQQRIEAMRLLKSANMAKITGYNLADVKKFQNLLSNAKIQLVVCDGTKTRTPLYRGHYFGSGRTVGLRLVDGHFDHIKRVSSFIGRQYYCASCDVIYDSDKSHYKCGAKCGRCGRKDSRDCVGNSNLMCETCEVVFQTNSCLDHHRKKGVRGGKSYCEALERCTKCRQRDTSKRTGRPHRCNFSYCNNCQTEAKKGHKTCFVSPIGPISKTFVKRTIVFHIESTAKGTNDEMRTPNLIVALRSCEHCERSLPSSSSDTALSCDHCGGQKLHMWNSFDNRETNILEDFVDWLFSQRKFTVIAHDLSGFDGLSILRHIAKTAALEEENFILTDRKLMYLEVDDARFVDSLTFLNMPLYEFSDTFGITELKKSFFPHSFNKPENYNYRDAFPSLDQFVSPNLPPKLIQEITEWHAAAKDNPFNFREQLEASSLYFVLLLHEGIRRFDEEIFTSTGVRVFHEARTSASAAMKIFRRKFLTPNVLAIEKKETPTENQSRLAIKYLSWLRHSTSEDIQDARNGGEFQVPGTTYKVDGFVDLGGGRGKIYEIHGDYYHACECRYTDDDKILGSSAYKIRCRDRKRLEAIKSRGYEVVVVRECEIKKMLLKDDEMARYFKRSSLEDPLKVSEGFSVGRREVYKLSHECEEDEEIVHLKFSSLYPTVNKYEPYPVGLGRTIAGDKYPVPISRPGDLKVKGFVKCTIVPPRGLHIPVLLMKEGGKNCYTLCRSCALAQNPFERCAHDDEQREITGVWTSEELKLALEQRYVITRIYQARHYDEWKKYEISTDGTVKQKGVMSEYINFFEKRKTEASGWPLPDMTHEEKQKYIDDYFEKEGIRLDERKIEEKRGRGCKFSEAMSNSLWGKLGERNSRRSNKIFHSPNEKTFINNEDNTILAVIKLTDFKELVVYQKVEESFDVISTTSKATAALTTAYARIRLYRAMQMIETEKILYCDTDSVIFIKKKTESNPLESLMGSYMGCLSSEITSNARCDQFVAVAPKTYGYRLRFDDGSVKEIVKCKDSPLSSEDSEKRRFEEMKEMVEKIVNTQEIEQFAHNKRCIAPNSYVTIPYGF